MSGSLMRTLPADRGARLLKVGAHDDHEALGPALLDAGLEQLGVLLGLLRVVDRSRADDDEQSVILSVDDGARQATRAGNRGLRLLGHGDLVEEQRGRDQRLKASDAHIVDVGVFVLGSALEDGLREGLGGTAVGRVGGDARRHG